MLSLLSTSSESVFTSTLFAVPVLFPGEPRGEQTRFDFRLNGLAPRSGVYNSLRFPDTSTSLGW
jgi:hypothetical protein